MSLTVYTKQNPLVETFDFTPERVLYEAVDPSLSLNEDAKPAKRMVIEGVFQRADVPNKNKRVYPKAVWEKHCAPDSAMQKRIAERSMIGHVEHPTNGTTDLNQAAILVTNITLKENGEVWGRAIVYNTPAGRIVQEMIETGTKYGISSRGTGSVDSKGIVQEDYQCETWDIVFNPSTPGAFPKLANEKTEESTVTVKNEQQPITEAAKSVEQKLFLAGGPSWVAGKTGYKDNDLALVFGRFLSFTIQRGAMFSELEPMWAEFLKFYPQVGKDPSTATGDLPASKPADANGVVPGANEKPANQTIPQPNGDAKLPESEDAMKKAGEEEAAKKIKLDEEAKALLVEAKAAVTRLEGEVAALTEKHKTVTVELESSKAAVSSLTEDKNRLQSEVDTYVKTLGALTAVNVAAQVREATESAIRADSRLAAFRDVLEAQATPAAVGARAQKLVESLVAVTSKPATAPVKGSLEERIKERERLAEKNGLPSSAVVSSDDDAKRVSESAVQPKPVHAGAAAAAGAIRRLNK